MLLGSKKYSKNRLFKKKEINIFLIIFFLIVNFFIFSTNQNNLYFTNLKKFLNLTPYSFHFFINSISENTKSLSGYLISKKKLNQKIESLEKDLNLIKIERLLNKEIEFENEELHKIINIRKKYFKNSIISKILKINYSGKENHFLIDSGSEDQVELGQIVVDQNGIVGQIINVNKFTSEVMSYKSKEFLITGFIKSKSKIYQSLIQGNGNKLIIKYHNNNIPVNVNDEIFTTGDSIFIPKGLRIGKIESLENSQRKDFKTLHIRPSSNQSNINYLIILR